MFENVRSWLIAVLAMIVLAVAAGPVAAGPGLPDDPTQEGEEIAPPLTDEQAEQLAQFAEPDLTPEETAAVLENYRHVDPDRRIPPALRDRALVYFHVNRHLLENPRFVSVIDFAKPSRLPRFHIADMTTGAVLSLHSAHGTGSDPDNNGTATLFSNTPNSKMSSLGFYKTAETYTGKHGLSLRLDGLSPTNSNVRVRAVVIHGADYVEDSDVKPGRSWGCPAVSAENHVKAVNALKGGSLILGERSN